MPATIRFANSSGNPAVADGAPGMRSMAVKLTLPDGKQTDILANSVEGFVASTPDQLLEFLAPSFRTRPPARPTRRRCRATSANIPAPLGSSSA